MRITRRRFCIEGVAAAVVTASPVGSLAQALPPVIKAPKRSSLAPDIPTLAESGFLDLHGVSSMGFFVRGGTARTIVERYSAEINAILKASDGRRRLAELGAEPAGGTPDEFRRLILSERARWAPVAREANIGND